MSIPFAGTISADCVTFTGVTGKNYVIAKSHPNNVVIRDTIKELLRAKKAGDTARAHDLWVKVETQADVPAFVKIATKGRVEIKDGTVYYDGEALHSALADRIVWGLGEGFDMSPYVAFLENLMENPAKRAVDELFLFLEKCNMGITDDGHIIAYKRVRDNYFDIYTGKVDHSVGQKPSMPRNKVDEDKNRTCSSGFHFCSMTYLPHFGAGPGNRIVIVKVNPRDVVAIPADYNHAKARCCTYEVIGEYTGSDKADILSSRSVWRAADVERNFGSSTTEDEGEYEDDTSWDSEDDLDAYDYFDDEDESEDEDSATYYESPVNPWTGRSVVIEEGKTPDKGPSQSSVIRKFEYNNGTLRIEFHNGSTYDYFNVPRRVYEEFRKANSWGKFFNQEISGVYSERLV